jgi:nucleoside recognition membrane protein YjiH
MARILGLLFGASFPRASARWTRIPHVGTHLAEANRSAKSNPARSAGSATVHLRPYTCSMQRAKWLAGTSWHQLQHTEKWWKLPHSLSGSVNAATNARRKARRALLALFTPATTATIAITRVTAARTPPTIAAIAHPLSPRPRAR